MKQSAVVSLAQYKAKLMRAGNTGNQAAEPTLPEANRLWELLDKNISLSVWLQAN
jgi:hypothetical protein